ncbi:MAG: rod shape-determining protein MreD [Gemmatimonadota bacterium]|nr:rod shape-determining protein MreD [Gemmatimonadota bacterium]MDQ8166971.1 rod shape-determining protein MreD [Gemmatimonadota bacterium]MDQ8171677.1 rod shape-determining protein MreD [Gemmatimonadota bacterium]
MNRPSSQTPGVGSAMRAWLGFALLLTAHFAIRPLIGGRAHVDFVLIAILFAAVRMRPGFAAVVGLLTGLALDALAPGTFGASALALTVVAFGASWLKAVFFADHVALTGLFVFAGKWLFDVALTLLTGGAAGTSWIATVLLWSPLSAALTALFATVLLTLFRPLYRPHAL